jgi:hypothetical protein
MKRVCLTTSFAHVVTYDTGTVLPEFRANVEGVLKSLRADADVEVFCALEAAGWKISTLLPELSVHTDIDELDAADMLIALMYDQPSVEVQFEIGYMVAKGKPVVLAMQAGSQMAYFNQGLVSGGLATLITYDDPPMLAKQLAIAVHAPDPVRPTT